MKIKLLIYTDLRSPFARDWINLVAKIENISLLTICSKTARVVHHDQRPIVAYEVKNPSSYSGHLRSIATKIRQFSLMGSNGSWFEKLVNQYKLFNLSKDINYLQSHIDNFKPDIIHGMRIPYEGITVSRCKSSKPIILSIWGNDLTLHATAGGAKARQISLAVQKATAIHADAQRDMNTCWKDYGFSTNKSHLVAPASGGVNTNSIRLDISKAQAKIELGYDPDTLLVCNPRGIRPYVDTNLFVSACENLVDKVSHTTFIAASVGDSINGWKNSPDASNNNSRLITTDALDIDRFRLLIRAVDILVSPTHHDGVPISLIEGMGSGAFPILSNLESVAGFVRSDDQGRLFELGSPQVLSNSLFDVIKNVDLGKASVENEKIIKDEYSIDKYQPKVEKFYKQVYSDSLESI